MRDGDREKALQVFAQKMRQIRDAQPDETAVQVAKDTIERLLEIARRDTGQSRIVANFLLAWWNAGACGGFDLTELWAVDTTVAADMVTVFSILPNWQHYPDSAAVGLGAQFEKLVIAWRPDKEAYWSGEPR